MQKILNKIKKRMKTFAEVNTVLYFEKQLANL